MKIEHILFFGIFILLIGCDTMSGVRRTESSDLVDLPSIECVTNALSKLDGVSSVKYELSNSKRTVHYFNYKWKNATPAVYFAEQRPGKYLFRHSYLMGVSPKVNGLTAMPSEKINDALEIMPKVESSLEKSCAVKIPNGSFDRINP